MWQGKRSEGIQGYQQQPAIYQRLHYKGIHSHLESSAVRAKEQPRVTLTAGVPLAPRVTLTVGVQLASKVTLIVGCHPFSGCPIGF